MKIKLPRRAESVVRARIEMPQGVVVAEMQQTPENIVDVALPPNVDEDDVRVTCTGVNPQGNEVGPPEVVKERVERKPTPVKPKAATKAKVEDKVEFDVERREAPGLKPDKRSL